MRGQTWLAAAVLSLSLVGAPTLASAEGAYPSYHDERTAQAQCVQEQRRRTATGAIIGGAAGVALGSGVASDGARTEGGILAGVIGAVAGAMLARGPQCEGPAQGDYDPYDNGPHGDPYGHDPYDDGTELYGGPYGPPPGRDARDCQWRDDYRGQPVFMCRDSDGRWRPE